MVRRWPSFHPSLLTRLADDSERAALRRASLCGTAMVVYNFKKIETVPTASVSAHANVPPTFERRPLQRRDSARAGDVSTRGNARAALTLCSVLVCRTSSMSS